MIFLIDGDIDFLFPHPDLGLGGSAFIIVGWNIQHRFFSFKSDVAYADTVVKVSASIVGYPLDIRLKTVHSIGISHVENCSA